MPNIWSETWSRLEQTRHWLRQKRAEYNRWLIGNPPSGFPPKHSFKKSPFESADESEASTIQTQYESEIENLEIEISKLRSEISREVHDPYKVLEIPPSATGKEIYRAYLRARESRESGVAFWRKDLNQLRAEHFPVASLKKEDKEWGEVYFSHNLEANEYALGQVEIAYNKLRKEKPYDPDASWLRRLFSR